MKLDKVTNYTESRELLKVEQSTRRLYSVGCVGVEALLSVKNLHTVSLHSLSR